LIDRFIVDLIRACIIRNDADTAAANHLLASRGDSSRQHALPFGQSR
jgi:hypothetical protein